MDPYAKYRVSSFEIEKQIAGKMESYTRTASMAPPAALSSYGASEEAEEPQLRYTPRGTLIEEGPGRGERSQSGSVARVGVAMGDAAAALEADLTVIT